VKTSNLNQVDGMFVMAVYFIAPHCAINFFPFILYYITDIIPQDIQLNCISYVTESTAVCFVQFFFRVL